MTTTEIEKRLTALEAEVADLKSAPKVQNRWWDKIAGVFANNPDFEQAMRYGRQWRESLRPKARSPKKRSAVRRKAGK